jgi:RNase P protein component
MRELVRERIQRGEIAAGWDVVFIARHPIREASYPQIGEAIDFLLYRAELVSEVV